MTTLYTVVYSVKLGKKVDLSSQEPPQERTKCNIMTVISALR